MLDTHNGQTHLAICGRRVLVKQHWHLLRRRRRARPNAQRADVHCDRLLRADGDCQAAIIIDGKTADVTCSVVSLVAFLAYVRICGAHSGDGRTVDDVAVRPAW